MVSSPLLRNYNVPSINELRNSVIAENVHTVETEFNLKFQKHVAVGSLRTE